MSRDNVDRYGKRHRNDPAYDVGESSPGDVGDSQGTFHDRARQNNNIIVDGEVRSIESHERSSSKSTNNNKSKKQSKRGKNNQSGSISQSEAEGKVVELTVESGGGTRDTMASYKNHQVHIEGGTPGETIRVKLERGEGYLVGRKEGIRE